MPQVVRVMDMMVVIFCLNNISYGIKKFNVTMPLMALILFLALSTNIFKPRENL